MEKGNPYSFHVVLADGIMEIPQDSNLSWITLLYALPKELVGKRPAYLGLPRNIHQLLHSKEYCKMLQPEMFLELVWNCYAWAAWQFFQVPGKGGAKHDIPGNWSNYSGVFPHDIADPRGEFESTVLTARAKHHNDFAASSDTHGAGTGGCRS